jgi:beta-galactosidase
VDRPTLYAVRTVVRQAGVVIDEVTTRCGFRTLRFDPDQGFFLNDQPLKLKGTCNHQDHAGSAWPCRTPRGISACGA